MLTSTAPSAVVRRVAFRSAFAAALLSVVLPVGAFARPAVKLVLSGEVVGKDAAGHPSSTPLKDAQPHPGDLIRWEILASNAGDSAATNFEPVGRIPAGTSFVAGTVAGPAARVEFSLDGGKTWSTSPKVHVKTATGDTVKTADPSTYTAVRWIAATPFAPRTSARFTYEVRVK